VIVGIDDPEVSQIDNYWRNVGMSLYLTIAAFTAGGSFRPYSFTGKAFVLTWTFTALVLVTSYTANMASMLVVSRAKESVVADVEDATARGLPVCVYRNGAFDEFIRAQYPHLNIRYPAEWTYESLRTGECAAMIKDHTSFKVDRGLSKYNKNCDLEFAGAPLTDVYSSFAAQPDPGSSSGPDDDILCTDLLVDVVNAALHDMGCDGWLRREKIAILDGVHDQRCGIRSRNEGDGVLALDHFSGLFLLQLCAALVCLLASWYFVAPTTSSKDSSRGMECVPCETEDNEKREKDKALRGANGLSSDSGSGSDFEGEAERL
jgi:hypothetical protein